MLGLVPQCLLSVQHRPLRRGERRRHDHVADVVAPTVIPFQPRRVSIRFVGPLRHGAAHEFADASQVGLGERQLVGLQVVRHRQLKGRVRRVPVQTSSPAVALSAVAVGLLRSRERRPIRGLDVVVGHTATVSPLGQSRRGRGDPLVRRGQRHPDVL